MTEKLCSSTYDTHRELGRNEGDMCPHMHGGTGMSSRTDRRGPILLLLLTLSLFSAVRNYLFDLDGTLAVRGEQVQNPSSDRLPGSIDEATYVTGDSFEGRPVYFSFQRHSYPVYFRLGTYKLLKQLSCNGENKITIATHACEGYAKRLAAYLRRQVPNSRIYVVSFPRTEPKKISFQYEFIVEDKPQRWLPGTKSIVCVPKLTPQSAPVDNAFGRILVAYIVKQQLPSEVVMKIAGYAHIGVLALRLCVYCNAWGTQQPGQSCPHCQMGDNSDTNHSDRIDSESSDGKSGDV